MMKRRKLLACAALSLALVCCAALPAFAAAKYQPKITAGKKSYTMKMNQVLFGSSDSDPYWYEWSSKAGTLNWSGVYVGNYDVDDGGVKSELWSSDLRYSTSNKKVAVIDDEGSVYPKGVGTCTVKAFFPGDDLNLSCSAKVNVKVIPKSVSAVKAKGGKQRVAVSWKRLPKSQASGYQVRYSKKTSMSGSKTKSVKGAASCAKTITGLKANAKYYVQVRAYKAVNGKKYYGKWSSVKSCKTKPLVTITGKWKEVGGNGKTRMSITSSKIRVYWDMGDLFWEGTYTVKKKGSKYVLVSKRSAALDSEALSSSDDSMTFTYSKGVISYRWHGLGLSGTDRCCRK